MKTLPILLHAGYMVSSIILTISNSLYNVMLKGDYDPSNWYTPLRIDLPFDQSSYLGYLLRVLINITIGLMWLMIMCTAVSFFISCCFYIEAILMHLKDKLQAIDNRFKEMNGKINENELNQMYDDAVLFHIEIFEYDSIYFFNCEYFFKNLIAIDL